MSNLKNFIPPQSEKTNPQKDMGDCFLGFSSVSLEETNRLAQMLTRVDNKYVMHFKQFSTFVNKVQSNYAVLDIDGRQQFSYASCYYDDDFGCYFDHHQGRRLRFKVRTREYVNTGSVYFEIKLKGPRGVTNKHRIKCDSLISPRVEGCNLDMLNEIYSKSYKKEMPYHLRPALMVTYKRCTLVALQGGERVTVDYALGFAPPDDENAQVRINNNFIIVETKSSNGKGFADTTLAQLKIRKASKCSKYCIGVNLTKCVSKNNYFLPTLKRVRSNIETDIAPPTISEQRIAV